MSRVLPLSLPCASETLDAVGALVVVVDREGRIVAFNRACSEFTGYRAEEVLGRSVFEILLPADEAPEVRGWIAAAQPENFPTQRELRWVDKDGAERPIAWTTHPLLDADGRIVQFVSTGIDVSSQRTAERDAERWRSRTESFLNHAPALAYWKDLDGRFVFVNRRHEQLTGLPREQTIGRLVEEVFAPADAAEFRAEDERVARTGRPASSEATVVHGDEDHHYFTVKFPLHGPDGTVEGVGGISTDITERVLVEKELERSYHETLRRLARAVEFRDNDTGEHIERMSSFCELIARGLSLGEQQCALIRAASTLHDAGKIAIPDEILLKPGSLTDRERAIMQTHAATGHQLLTGSASPLLQLAASIALTHHERYDGTGYPRRLAGHDIPIEGRIAAVADVFDALTSDRVYRPALPIDEAIELMDAERGRHFDPIILDTFLAGISATHNATRPAARAESAPTVAHAGHA
jgi:putative two-component system response regulator